MIRLSQMLGINAFSGIVVHLETKLPKGSNGPGIEQEDNNLPGQNTPICLYSNWLAVYQTSHDGTALRLRVITGLLIPQDLFCSHSYTISLASVSLLQ